MADAPTQTAEVVARSFVPEGTPRVAPLTPEQQINQDAANVLSQRLQVSREDPLAALRPVEERVPLSFDLDRELNRRFGVEGVPREAGEEARFDEARKLGDTRKLLAERGYESLTADQQNELITSLITEALDKRPAFQGLEDEEVTAIAQEMLMNPNYQKKVGEMLVGRLKLEEVIEASSKLAEAQEAYDKASQALTDIGNERLGARIDHAGVERYLDEFNEATASGIRGAKFEELETLHADDEIRRIVTDNTIESLKARGLSDEDIDRLKTRVMEKIRSGEDITAADEVMARTILEYQSDIDRMRELEAERANLETERERLSQRLLDIPDEMLELQNTRDERENELLSARAQKMIQEQAVVENMRRVASSAGDEILDNEIQKRATEYQNQLNEQLQQVKDADEKKILEKKKSRWDRGETKGDNIRFTVMKRVVNSDMREILLGDGPEAIVKEMLLEGVTDPQERDRIEKRLVEDKEFVKKWTDDIASTVLTKKLQSGRLYEGEIRVMLDRPWGQVAIDKAIVNDKAKRAAIEKIYGSDSGRPSYVDRIKRAAGSNWMKFLMLLLMGGVAGGALTARFVAQEGGR